MVELTGARVVLRTLTLDDVEALAADDAHRERLRKQAERSPTLADGGFLSLVVVGDGAVVGDIQARAPKGAFPPRTCEIGITLFPDARGRGFGLEAVMLFTEYLLRESSDRVQASTSADNIAMRTVLERAGYEFEGVLRSYAPGENGREDYAVYGAVSQQTPNSRVGAPMRSRFALTVLTLAAASALCVALVELRIDRTGDSFYRFMVWNLFLAWVPFILAILAFHRAQRRLDGFVGVLLVLWLLFFPNAPYMLTDFIHLGESESVPVWYDALMLSTFAWTALLLGYASLYLVQRLARRVVGLTWSWVVVVGALALSSFGVYLGRFVRFNSWDALIRPGRVLDVISNQVENPLQHPRMIAVLIALTAFLLVGYAVLYAFAGMRLELEREP